MATIYKIDMEIVSEFCAYNEGQLQQRLLDMIKEWRDPETRLGLLAHDIKVTKKV